MIARSNLEGYHEAAKMIEVDGVNAYQTVSERFGKEIAEVLIVAFLRRNLGSMNTFPPKEEIIRQTNAVLSERGLLQINAVR